MRQAPRLLPADLTVIEIVEDVRPDDEVLAACGSLRGLGIVWRSTTIVPARLGTASSTGWTWSRWTLACGPDERSRLARDLRRWHCTLVAEKVETPEMFHETLDIGYELFQGFFFARPTIVSGRDIPTTKLSCLRVLREVYKTRMDLHAVSQVIEQEVALSYKLLRCVNAACYGWRGAVRSIQQAAALLGERELRRWASVVAVAGMANDEPDELVRLALARGCFCEELAPEVGLADARRISS